MVRLPEHLRALAVLAGLAGTAIVLAGCESSCCGLTSPMDAQEKQKDETARLEYYRDAAKTYYEGGKYDSAVEMWGRVLQITPADKWAKFGMGKSLQMVGTVKSLRQAEQILEPLLKEDWTSPSGNVKYRVQTTLALTYSDLADYYDRDVRGFDALLIEERLPDRAADLRLKKQQQIAKRNELLAKAIPLFEAVLTSSKDDPYALGGLAKAHLQVGNEVRGIEFARRYASLAHHSQEKWQGYMEEWPKLLGQAELSRDQRAFYSMKIQGARDKEKGMLLLLGSTYMRREEFADAITAYDDVLKIDPAVAPAYVERAQAYAKIGQYALAVRDVEEYLKLTDPVKQRTARLNAAELLERYQKLAERGPSMVAASSPGPIPPGTTGFGGPGNPDGVAPPPPPQPVPAPPAGR